MSEADDTVEGPSNEAAEDVDDTSRPKIEENGECVDERNPAALGGNTAIDLH